MSDLPENLPSDAEAPADANQPGLADPPAAEIVANAEITEETLALQKRLDDSERARKKAETDAAHLADENRRLKDVGLRPAASEAAAVDQRSALERWMEGEEV